MNYMIIVIFFVIFRILKFHKNSLCFIIIKILLVYNDSFLWKYYLSLKFIFKKMFDLFILGKDYKLDQIIFFYLYYRMSRKSLKSDNLVCYLSVLVSSACVMIPLWVHYSSCANSAVFLKLNKFSLGILLLKISKFLQYKILCFFDLVRITCAVFLI